MSTKSLSGIHFDPDDIPLSCDLVMSCRYLLDFLADVSLKPELYEGPLMECAIQRYERYWLPLVAKHPGRLLPAPLDIEWVWHCHMLSPTAYNMDCQNIVGRLVDHQIMDRAQRKELMPDSERLWKKEYADVPFYACEAVTPWYDCEFVSALTYNLTSAVARQRIFYYQVSLPHYRDEKFLNIALMRYRKFLFLKCHYPHLFLVPCYDNDLLWHTHMLHPVIYKSDTEAYLGTLLPHDDSVNDRTAGSKLCLSEAKTRNLWRKVFNEKFSHFGAMYRGDPPNSKLASMSREDILKVCTKQVNVLIEKVRISGLPPNKTFKLKLCYNTGYQNFNRSLFVTENIITVKGNSRTLEDSKLNAPFSFDTRYNDKLIASLQQKSGKLCLGTSDVLGEGKIDLQKKIQLLNAKGLTANDEIDCGDGLSIGVVWSCPVPKLGPCVLRLEPGNYESCVMPEDRESLWGPIPLPRLPPGQENYCSVASHKLFNHTRRVVFTVRMIHSEPLLMSAVHVFYGDKMAVVAHLVVGDQLPLPISVGEPKKCITLNPREGQRAVLIKNNKGDWGVAVGWWDGFQKRTSGRKGSGSEGHLEVRFYHMATHRWHYVSFDRLYSLATSKFEIGDCVVEFDSGFIEINSSRFEIAENLALIFSVALIHVLCQPRPSNWNPRLYSSPVSEEERQQSRLGGSEEIALLLAAGVLIATPCNHAIKNLFKRKKESGMMGWVRPGSSIEDSGADTREDTSVIQHEAEVSAEWGSASNRNSQDGSELGGSVSAGLTVIAEQEGAEEEEEAKQAENQAEDGHVSEVTETTALLAVRETAVPEEEEGAEPVTNEEVDEDVRNSLEVEDAANDDVFEPDADSQTGLFGNGEDDSDEVDLEDDDDDADDHDEDDGFGGRASLGDDRTAEDEGVFGLSSGELTDQDHFAYEGDPDNYYNEFYNIDADYNQSGLYLNGGDDHLGPMSNPVGNHVAVNIWDRYGDDSKTDLYDTGDKSVVANHSGYDGGKSFHNGDDDSGGHSHDYGGLSSYDGDGDDGHDSGGGGAIFDFGSGGSGDGGGGGGFFDFGGGGGGDAGGGDGGGCGGCGG